MTVEEFRAKVADMLELECAACLRDIVPGDKIGERYAHERASALATAAADVRNMSID